MCATYIASKPYQTICNNINKPNKYFFYLACPSCTGYMIVTITALVFALISLLTEIIYINATSVP